MLLNPLFLSGGQRFRHENQWKLLKSHRHNQFSRVQIAVLNSFTCGPERETIITKNTAWTAVQWKIPLSGSGWKNYCENWWDVFAKKRVRNRLLQVWVTEIGRSAFATSNLSRATSAISSIRRCLFRGVCAFHVSCFFWASCSSRASRFSIATRTNFARYWLKNHQLWLKKNNVTNSKNSEFSQSMEPFEILHIMKKLWRLIWKPWHHVDETNDAKNEFHKAHPERPVKKTRRSP